MATLARIAGTVAIDGAAASRNVIVIKNDPSAYAVIGTAVSQSDGSFDIEFSDWDGAVIALAVDNYGGVFQASKPLDIDTVIHPTIPNGFVYYVTIPGTTGVSEPVWKTGESVVSGSVTFDPRPYYRPIASGPLKPEQLEESEPPAPWILHTTPYLPSIVRARVLVSIPPCRAGDFLIAWGLRRGEINTPSGWTAIAAPPGPDPSGSNQSCYMFYKVADGSEGSSILDVKYVPAGAQRLTLQVAVIRCADGYQIDINHVSSVRQPNGAAGATPLAATNINKKALMIGVTCWLYSVTADEAESYANIAHATAKQLSYNNKMINDIDNSATSEQLRGIGVALAASPLESISIGLSTESLNNSDSRTDIWIALSTSTIT